MQSCAGLFAQAFHGALEPPPVKICEVDATVGRGLVATRNIKRGEIIFTESAAVSVVEDSGVPSCGNCLCSLAGVDASPILAQLPHLEHFDPPPVACRCVSCGALYCGERCRMQAELLFHGRLCGNQTAVDAFLAPYDTHTQLVARMMLQIVAMMLTETRRNGGDHTMACEPFLRWTAQRNAAEPSYIPVSRFHEVIQHELPLTPEEASWLDVSLLDTISAMVCLNSIQIRMRSPFAEYFSVMKRRVSEEDKSVAVDQIMKIAGGIPAAEADGFFHELCGTRGAAMFALHACCNHSCAPVAEVRCQGFTDSTIDVVAIEDIFRGDPITITYVNPKLRWSRRCEILHTNYGFICACSRCAVEYDKPKTKGGDDDDDDDDTTPAAAADDDDEAETDSDDCDIDPGEWEEVEDALGNEE